MDRAAVVFRPFPGLVDGALERVRAAGIGGGGLRVVGLDPVENPGIDLETGIGRKWLGRWTGKEDTGHFRVGSRPVCSLMSEVKRVVVVYSHDQVIVITGQLQLG